MGKPVLVSGLVLKFYEVDGWNKEILNQYVRKGGFLKRGSTYGGGDSTHYIPEFESVVDYDKMYADGLVSKLIGKNDYKDLQGLTDLEALKKRGNHE